MRSLYPKRRRDKSFAYFSYLFLSLLISSKPCLLKSDILKAQDTKSLLKSRICFGREKISMRSFYPKRRRDTGFEKKRVIIFSFVCEAFVFSFAQDTGIFSSKRKAYCSFQIFLLVNVLFLLKDTNKPGCFLYTQLVSLAKEKIQRKRDTKGIGYKVYTLTFYNFNDILKYGGNK